MESPGNQEKKKKPIGELLVEAGLISAAQLPQGLEYAQKTALPLGRVLMMLRLLKESDLQSALHAQSMMKVDNLPVNLAVKAISMSCQRGISVESALKILGWTPGERAQGSQSREITLALDELSTAERALGPDHLEVAQHLLKVGDLCVEVNEYGQAEQHFQRALTILERGHGPIHIQVSNTLHKLANLYFVQDRYDEAEPLYWRVFEIKQRVLGEAHIEVADCLQDLAELYDVQSQYHEAERFYLSSIGIKEKILGADAPELLDSLKKLAFVCKQQERRPERKQTGELLVGAGMVAPQKLEEGLKIAQKYKLPLGQALISLHQLNEDDLQRVLHAQALIKDAVVPAHLAIKALKLASHKHIALEQALEQLGWNEGSDGSARRDVILHAADDLVRLEHSLGPEHPDVAQAYMKLAELNAAYGRIAEAEGFFKRGIQIYEDSLGANNSAVASALSSLADFYMEQGNLASAEPIYLRAMDITEQLSGAENIEVAAVLHKLGILRFAQANYRESGRLFQLAMETREKVLGPRHLSLSESIEKRADCYMALQRYDAAEPLYLRALQITQNILPSTSRPVGLLVRKLGELHVAQCDFPTAAARFDLALKIMEQSGGEGDLVLSHLHRQMGSCLTEMARWEPAERHFLKALQILEQAPGAEHPEVATVLEAYARLLRLQGQRSREAFEFEERAQKIRLQQVTQPGAASG